jgi:hypothetical protein
MRAEFFRSVNFELLVGGRKVCAFTHIGGVIEGVVHVRNCLVKALDPCGDECQGERCAGQSGGIINKMIGGLGWSVG